MQRIAIVFDNTLRPETTGGYCLLALEELVREGSLTTVEHLLPPQLTDSEACRFDAVLVIDDGLDCPLPRLSVPTAWWAIDTHLSFSRCLQRARQVDLTFAAQKNGAQQLHAEGIPEVQWLPLACDPHLHGRVAVDNCYDVAFIGSVFPGARTELLQLIRKSFPRAYIGQCDYRQMAEVYSAAKIVFNCSLRDDINMRVFEGLCSGSLLVTNDLSDNGQEELFQADKHLVTYRSHGELLEKVRYYLNYDAERNQIADMGRSLVINRHTYRHRMEQLLLKLREIQPQSSKNPNASACRTTQQFTKSLNYYEFDRPDVQKLVPQSATKILDIGCGSGRLGEAIKRRQIAQVTGVELNEEVLCKARARLDYVIAGDIQSTAIDFPEESFDCVICADILEHLRDPLAVLRRIQQWLMPEGTLIASLPNVRNHRVIRSLLAGNWTYESAGLLDEDHVRFFTRREIEKLLFRAGFEVKQIGTIPDDGYQEWQKQGSPLSLQLGPFQLHAGSTAEAEEFFTYQYLTVAKPRSKRNHDLISIILVTFNQLRHTLECLESIRLRTDLPYELIVVDNASTDGTPETLGHSCDIRLIRNATNRGFPAAVNQGLRVANGDLLLLLNNDTVVTTGWLERLSTALYSSSEIGLVGPVSNNVSGEQQVPISYDDLSQLDGFAWDWGKRHDRQIIQTDRLVGFCLLVKREVFNKVGLLDERFGIGNFEDDDFCRRAINAGYQAKIAVDAFVHHFGSATFRASGIRLDDVLQKSHRIYLEKWATPLSKHFRLESPNAAQESHEVRPPQFLFDVTEQGELQLKPNDIRLSACLIVRNNERTIRPCLASLKPFVDEIVVVDTGSEDKTPDICKELGARVFHWSWRDSFSAARNESLRHARGQWIFWMDSDDTIPEECGRKLQTLASDNHPPHTLGYVIQVHCPGSDPHDVTVVDHVKLIRNRHDLIFEFRIHEQILPAIRRAGGEVQWSDIYVVHSGSDRTPEGRAGKLKRDFRLLELDLKERPDHPFVLFNLGMTFADDGQDDQAVHYLKRCIEFSEPQESHLRKAYALLTGSLSATDRTKDAWEACQEGLAKFPDDRELLFRMALLLHQQGALDKAAQIYRQLLSTSAARHFSSIDFGIAGHKARHNLALVYESMQRFDDAICEWRSVLTEIPNYVPAIRGVGECLIRQRLFVDLDKHLASIADSPGLKHVYHLLKAKMLELEGPIVDAGLHYRCAVDSTPGDPDLQNELCRFLFEHGEFSDAIAALQELVKIDPHNAAAFHNLGACHLQQADYRQAVSALNRSLQLRPRSPMTENLRFLALEKTGTVTATLPEAVECNVEVTNDGTLVT